MYAFAHHLLSFTSPHQAPFALDCLKTGSRIDGRAFTAFRRLEVELPSNGRCVVSLGGLTKVSCAVDGEVVPTSLDRPDEGRVAVAVELASSVVWPPWARCSPTCTTTTPRWGCPCTSCPSRAPSQSARP